MSFVACGACGGTLETALALTIGGGAATSAGAWWWFRSKLPWWLGGLR